MVADGKIFYSEGRHVNNVIAFAEKNNREIWIREIFISGAKRFVMNGKFYGIAFQIECDFHFKPMHVEQLVPIHGCNDQVVLAFFIEFKNKITALAIVEQIVDSVALFILDPDDIPELGGWVEREVELNIKMI